MHRRPADKFCAKIAIENERREEREVKSFGLNKGQLAPYPATSLKEIDNFRNLYLTAYSRIKLSIKSATATTSKKGAAV